MPDMPDMPKLRIQLTHFFNLEYYSVQSLSHVRLFATHESQHARPPCPSPEFTQTHVHRVRDAIQPSHPRLSPSPPAPNPSQHQSLSSESPLRMRWPKY